MWQTSHIAFHVQTVYMDEMQRFQVGEDSPVFSNMFKYCQVGTAKRLKDSVCINGGVIG